MEFYLLYKLPHNAASKSAYFQIIKCGFLTVPLRGRSNEIH